MSQHSAIVLHHGGPRPPRQGHPTASILGEAGREVCHLLERLVSLHTSRSRSFSFYGRAFLRWTGWGGHSWAALSVMVIRPFVSVPLVWPRCFHCLIRGL